MASEKSNYNDYILKEEGPMGKKIKDIILQDEKFIVYMDEDDTIQWAATNYGKFPKGIGEIQSMISFWESVANMQFSRKVAYDYKCLLAEGYARILDDKDLSLAKKAIDWAHRRMEIHGQKILKQYYILSSFFATLIAAGLICVSIIEKKEIIDHTSINVFEIWITALFGGIGSFVFSTLSIKKYLPDIFLKRKFHIIDGLLRVFYGFISGVIIALAIKANVLLGFIDKNGFTIYMMAFLGVMTGASELIIPKLISQTETNLNNTSSNSK